MTEVKPEDQGGVTDAILTAIAERAPMEIVGSATMRTIGRPLATPVKLDLSGLAGLNFYEPEELVLSAKAGTRRSAIDELLRAAARPSPSSLPISRAFSAAIRAARSAA